MLKLVCGLSRKVGEPNFGSRGASVSVEVELDSVTLRQPEKLKQHIRCGFDRIREAIEEELARPGPEGPGEEPQGRNGRRRGRRVRPATSSQLRLLRVLAGRKDVDLVGLCRDRCGKEDPAELTLAEASRLIDDLGGNREHERR